MKEETREKLLASGCTITEESNTMVLSCPLDILESGIRISGFSLIRAKRKDNKIMFYFEKE